MGCTISSTIPSLKKIIWVIGVLRRTAVWDWRFINMCGSHLQSQVKSLDSEDGFRTCCRNVSHQQQSFSRLQPPRWSFSIKVCYSWVQTISYQVQILMYNSTGYLRQFWHQRKLLNLLVPDSTKHCRLHFVQPLCDLTGFQYFWKYFQQLQLWLKNHTSFSRFCSPEHASVASDNTLEGCS